MPALHEEPFRPQGFGEPFLDFSGLRTRHALKMKHRPCQHFESALEHAARRANARLVLIEPRRGRVLRRADVDTKGPRALSS